MGIFTLTHTLTHEIPRPPTIFMGMGVGIGVGMGAVSNTSIVFDVKLVLFFFLLNNHL